MVRRLGEAGLFLACLRLPTGPEGLVMPGVPRRASSSFLRLIVSTRFLWTWSIRPEAHRSVAHLVSKQAISVAAGGRTANG
jgi:hypothetical protein